MTRKVRYRCLVKVGRKTASDCKGSRAKVYRSLPSYGSTAVVVLMHRQSNARRFPCTNRARKHTSGVIVMGGGGGEYAPQALQVGGAQRLRLAVDACA